MNPNRILVPVFSLVALTFFVLFRTAYVRIHALRTKRVDPKYFRALQGDAPPDLVNPARNLANLFETPVLFYVAAVLIWSAKLTDGLYLGYAWAFVLLRYTHSFIHLTTNRVTHRFYAFALASVVLALLWLRLVGHLLPR